jgi:predicted peptidase
MLLALIAAAPAPPTTAPAADNAVAGKQRPGKFEKQVTVTRKSNYLLYLPTDYGKEPDKKWPLIVFLHGSGERGENINDVKVNGPPKIVEKRYMPFVVLSPQCPAGQWWRPEEVMAVTDEIIAKYKCDPDRVYLTGLSMGGFGTWDTAIAYPDRFAAIAPVCGGGNPFRAPELKNVPVWAFHGELDRAVPISQTANMVSVLQQVGGKVRFTRYPLAQHDCWTITYDNRELYTWFLQHKRGQQP